MLWSLNPSLQPSQSLSLSPTLEPTISPSHMRTLAPSYTHTGPPIGSLALTATTHSVSHTGLCAVAVAVAASTAQPEPPTGEATDVHTRLQGHGHMYCFGDADTIFYAAAGFEHASVF